MKLYTEEKLIEIINELEKAFLPQNIECDGIICTGCWKDNVREALEMLKNLPSIELPSNEEIVKQGNLIRDIWDQTIYMSGAKWMRDKIQGGNK